MSNGSEQFGEDYFANRYGGTRGSYLSRTTVNKWRSMAAFIQANLPSAADALDVGCAEGSFLSHAVGAFPNIRWSGSDVSAYALQRARERLPGLSLLESPVDPLPFADGSFDLVTAFDVLEHVENLPAAVQQLKRVLRPGGYLVVTVPVYDGPIGRVVRALDRDPTHLHKNARSWWLSGALSQQFELLEWEGAWRYYLLRYWHLRARLGRALSPAIVMAWRRRA